MLGAYLVIKDKKIKTTKEVRICSLCKKDYTEIPEYDFCPKCAGEIDSHEVDHEEIRSGMQEINDHDFFIDMLFTPEYPSPKGGIYAFSNFSNCKSRINLGSENAEFVYEFESINLEDCKTEFIKRFGNIMQALDVAGFEYELKTGYIRWSW